MRSDADYDSAAWSGAVDRAPLAFVDLEMTGLDPRVDRVCELCVIRTEGERVIATVESLVRPEGAQHNAGASRIHGITPEELEGAPLFFELAPRLRSLLDGAVVVGHKVAFDVAFLEAEFARAGAAIGPFAVLDTLPLARRCFAEKSYRLADLSARLGIAQPRPHRAGDDARATLALFWRTVAELSPTTLRDLASVRVGERIARPEILARATQAIARAEPVVVRYRPSHRGACELPMVLTAMRADLDPPRVLGYLEPGRGRRELRADRILAILTRNLPRLPRAMAARHGGSSALFLAPFFETSTPVNTAPRSDLTLLLALCVSLGAASCSSQKNPQTAMSPEAAKWLDRGKASFRAGDVDDARDAVKGALATAGQNTEVRLFAARVYLARLEFAEVVRVLQGVSTSEARGLRGRAHWYAGEVEAAADELEAMLVDPNVKDEWAKQIARLARSGADRKPFQISGGLVASSAMPRIHGTSFIVPIEVDGEPGLALVATDKAEVVIDSAAHRDASWVQLRFGERIEVSNVPALSDDLSGISKELGAPIKALLGVNLLRHLHVTFDFGGEQFVVRSREPSPPPKATRVALSYALGGAMIVRVGLKPQAPPTSPMLVNTELAYPVALDEAGWKSLGIDLGSLKPYPGSKDPSLKSAALPGFRLGAFEVPGVPGFLGPSYADIRAATGVNVDGALGSGMLANFRCTLADGGRALWVEDLPEEVMGATPQSQSAPAPGSVSPRTGASSTAPATTPSPKAPATAPASRGPAR